MIPSLGASEFGLFATMIVASFAAVVFGLVAVPWTVARNAPQLKTRGRITVGLMIVGAALAAIAVFSPYEQAGGRCGAALPAYGMGLDDLATMHSEDRCAVPGQLLIVFAGSIVMAEVVGTLLWFVSRDPVLDADADADADDAGPRCGGAAGAPDPRRP
jgi:hypothetical protein